MGVAPESGTMRNLTYNISSIGAIKLRLKQAFALNLSIRAVPITRMAKKRETGTNYRIRVSDKENVKKVEEHKEWVSSPFESAKMKEDTKCLVVVDGVDKEKICNKSRTEIRPTAHEEIGKEININISISISINISKICFLGGANPGKNRCLDVLHMSDKREANHLTSRKYVESDEQMLLTRRFIARTGP